MSLGCSCDPTDTFSPHCSSGNCVPNDPTIETVGTCQPPVEDDSGSLLPSCGICYLDAECASGACVNLRCTQANGLLKDNCPCPSVDGDAHCESGRCDPNDVEFVCQAKLATGEACDEDTDCETGICNNDAVCAETETTQQDDLLGDGSVCTADAQCASGNCLLFFCVPFQDPFDDIAQDFFN
jgi:hypothetical protein